MLDEKIFQRLLALWKIKQPIMLNLRPRDAWTILGIVQYAARNPMLNDEQRQLIERFGRELQRGLETIDPLLAETMEQGWDPQFDR